MYIKTLKLAGFRNYDSLDVDFSKNVNVFYGDNGQGKTNILEAMFLCATGRSHRTTKDNELLKIGSKYYLVKMDIVREGAECNIEITFDMELKRRIRINEIPIKKIGNLIGHLNAVMFSPEDLMIIKEGPSERRRFLDITISQLKPSYFYDLQQYNKVLTQRNFLLKDIQVKKYLLDTLDVWNNNLVAIGSRIMKNRYDFLKRLNLYAKKIHKSLTEGKEELSIKYDPSFNVNDFTDIKVIEESFKIELDRSKNKELIKAGTLVGPQRDDFEVYLNGMNIRQFGSQGQQRTAILSLKLSEIDLMKEDTGEYPILLLDDVMSELDAKRQEYLIQNLQSIQTFVTCTERNLFAEKHGYDLCLFNVKNGVLKKESINLQ